MGIAEERRLIRLPFELRRAVLIHTEPACTHPPDTIFARASLAIPRGHFQVEVQGEVLGALAARVGQSAEWVPER